jgi:hypothetical protein
MSLNFLQPFLDSRITFTRGSNATLVDSTGKITYAPANLLLQSQTFDTASWTKLAATVTANTTVAPDDTSTADTIEAPVGGAGAPRVYQRPAITGSTTYTISSYFKASGTNFAFLSMRTAGVDWAGAEFNLSTGTVTRNATSGNVAYVDADIRDAGNGWYRCIVTVTPTDTVAAGVGFIFFGPSDGTSAFAGGYPSFTNVGTETVFIWGAQLEPVTYQTTPSTYVATTTAAYYGPRFDYDPVTLAAKGLLIEEARTNLLTYSEQFDNVLWLKTNAAITANSTAAPDGTNTADTLVENALSGQHRILQIVTTTAAPYTWTVYAKQGPGSKRWLNLYPQGAGVNATAIFDLTLGTVTSSGLGQYLNSSITAAGNGWYRCSISFTGAAVAVSCVAYLSNASNTSAPVYTGDGTSGIFVWGAQLELGAFATSYIPTVASQVTRSADVATMTGTNFSSWYNQSEGTFVTSADTFGSGSFRYALSASNGAISERITFFATTASALRYIVTDGNVAQADISLAGMNANVVNKVAGAYKINSFNAALNGVVGTEVASGTVPTPDRLLIGLDAVGSGFINGHIRQIAYYNTRLPNTELQTLTAPPLVTTLSLDFINGVYNA